jgi:N-methylhydantoinase A
MSLRYRVGVDVGGTFTDIVMLASDGTVHTRKISSSVEDYAAAIVEGLAAELRDTGIGDDAIDEIRHGTTVASNAILEQKGARVGLITTKGFRDVLEIGTLRMPRLFDITWSKPEPLVERYLRREVDERIDAAGRVERALDLADAQMQIDALIAENVEAIAVCLLNSYANPTHEFAIRDLVRQRAPKLPLSVSYEILPEIKEYERTSTTVVNAYVMPIVATYLRALRKGLDRAGIHARLLLMQSNGGLTTDSSAVERPVNIIESGPAGGVVGAQYIARRSGLARIITFDMGGTTAKAALVEDGQAARAQTYSVGAGIMMGSRLMSGAGYLLKVPHRPGRSGRRWRIACLDRPRWRAPGRARKCGRQTWPGLLRLGGNNSDHHGCQCYSGLHQPGPHRRRRGEVECRQGTPRIRRRGGQATGPVT